MEFRDEEPAEPEVAYEDDCLVAVLKPARMHSAPGLGAGDLCAWVFERFPDTALERYPDAAHPSEGGSPVRCRGAELRAPPDSGLRKAGAPAVRPGSEGGLLHRLDYETSGLVLFARNTEAFASLLDQQERGAFRKEYIALSSPSSADEPRGSRPARGFPEGVEAEGWAGARDSGDAAAFTALLTGAIGGRSGETDVPGGCRVVSAFRAYGPKGARVACLGPGGGAPAYRSDILAASARPGTRGGPGALELRLGLDRGFRHQLRAHLAWIGLPILGDPLYGGANDSRLRLYATRLSFIHPISGNAFSIELDR